jgi:hypothetical protein
MNSQLLVFVTDSSVRIMEAKVRTTSNQVINLIPSTSPQASNAFSLTNLPAGVYALSQKGNTKAAYEGILAIGQQPLTVIEETTRRVTNEYGDLILIFLPPEPVIGPDGSEVPPGEDCPPDPCDGPNPPPDCPQPPDPCDGPNPPPDCPQPTDPCNGPNPPPECEVPDPCDLPNSPDPCDAPEEQPGLFENGEEPPENGEEPPENGDEGGGDEGGGDEVP